MSPLWDGFDKRIRRRLTAALAFGLGITMLFALVISAYVVGTQHDAQVAQQGQASAESSATAAHSSLAAASSTAASLADDNARVSAGLVAFLQVCATRISPSPGLKYACDNVANLQTVAPVTITNAAGSKTVIVPQTPVTVDVPQTISQTRTLTAVESRAYLVTITTRPPPILVPGQLSFITAPIVTATVQLTSTEQAQVTITAPGVTVTQTVRLEPVTVTSTAAGRVTATATATVTATATQTATETTTVAAPTTETSTETTTATVTPAPVTVTTTSTDATTATETLTAITTVTTTEATTTTETVTVTEVPSSDPIGPTT